MATKTNRRSRFNLACTIIGHDFEHGATAHTQRNKEWYDVQMCKRCRCARHRRFEWEGWTFGWPKSPKEDGDGN